jgi:hypothetical protein
MFMHQHILNDYGILGKVKEYVNQYELQHCGSLHAHIILWVDTNDLERITNEIIVLVPTILMTRMQNLFYLVIVYNQNYSIWCYENNFINVNHNAFEKVKWDLQI